MRDYNRAKNCPKMTDRVYSIAVYKTELEQAVAFLQQALGREHLMMGK